MDLRKEDACSHCRSALSLLDPQAVEKALQNYAHTSVQRPTAGPTAVADAIVALAKDRSRSQRDTARPGPAGAVLGVFGVDLFRVGLGLVASLLDD